MDVFGFFFVREQDKSKIEKPFPSRCSTEGLCWAASAQVRLPQHSVPQIRCSAGTRDVWRAQAGLAAGVPLCDGPEAVQRQGDRSAAAKLRRARPASLIALKFALAGDAFLGKDVRRIAAALARGRRRVQCRRHPARHRAIQVGSAFKRRPLQPRCIHSEVGRQQNRHPAL